MVIVLIKLKDLLVKKIAQGSSIDDDFERDLAVEVDYFPEFLAMAGFSVNTLDCCELCPLLGISSAGVVTLQSMQIFTTHEWLDTKPTVYFHCQGENNTVLPDVKKTHYLYTFKGEESWQPLTELADKKCKRCGFYEKDTLKADDVFDEWEFCPSDFMAPDGKYVRFKEREFNATFLCPQCIQGEKGSSHTSDSLDKATKEKRMNLVLIVIISTLAVVVSTLGVVAAYRYWQKKKRERDQARFLKLFEDGDDIEDELGLGHVI